MPKSGWPYENGYGRMDVWNILNIRREKRRSKAEYNFICQRIHTTHRRKKDRKRSSAFFCLLCNNPINHETSLELRVPALHSDRFHLEPPTTESNLELKMIMDDIILSLFPQLTTHLKHVKNDPLSHLFPYDGIIAVASVTYCRYTVKVVPNESNASRVFWTAVLGYLAYNRFDYWILISAHILSFGPSFYDAACGYYSKKVNK